MGSHRASEGSISPRPDFEEEKRERDRARENQVKYIMHDHPPPPDIRNTRETTVTRRRALAIALDFVMGKRKKSIWIKMGFPSNVFLFSLYHHQVGVRSRAVIIFASRRYLTMFLDVFAHTYFFSKSEKRRALNKWRHILVDSKSKVIDISITHCFYFLESYML